MSETTGLAQFSLFLILAFLVPGIVYVVLIMIYFPDIVALYPQAFTGWGLVAATVFVGLILTAACFCVEVCLFYPLFDRLGWKKISYSKLGLFESAGISTLYLNQVYGQYILHFNVGLGSAILTAIFLFRNSSSVFKSWDCLLKITLGILIALTNIFLALRPFREIAVETTHKIERASPKKNGVAMILDLDNTLTDTDSVYREAKTKLCQELKSLGAMVEDIEKCVEDVYEIDRDLCAKFGTNVYDERQLVSAVCERLKIEANLETLTEKYRGWLDRTPELRGNVRAVLEELRARDVYLVCFSAGDQNKIVRTLQKRRIRHLFDEIHVVSKKDAEVFGQLASNLRNLGYSRVYSVGDSLRSDVLPSKQSGVTAVWIQGRYELEKPVDDKERPDYTVKNICELLRFG